MAAQYKHLAHLKVCVCDYRLDESLSQVIAVEVMEMMLHSISIETSNSEKYSGELIEYFMMME